MADDDLKLGLVLGYWFAGPPVGVPEAIAATLRPILVKGRGNYVSIRRLELATSRALSLFPSHAERESLDIIKDLGTDEDVAELKAMIGKRREALTLPPQGAAMRRRAAAAAN